MPVPNLRRIRPWMVGTALAAIVVIGASTIVWTFTSRTHGHTFVADGVRLHYTDEGSGTPVVLLHGFAVNADLNWRLPGLTDTLSRGFRVISLDLRGHGLSSKPHDSKQYGMNMALDVVALLDHLKIQRAHLVGYSLGGIIALKLATTHPERFTTVSNLAAGWEDPEDSKMLAALDGIAATLESGEGVPPLSVFLSGDRKEPSFMHNLWVRFVSEYLNDGKALAAMIRGLRGLAVQAEALAGIPIPICSIAGDRDPMKFGIEAMTGKIADHTVFFVEDADHLQATRSPMLAAELQNFLRVHSGSPQTL